VKVGDMVAFDISHPCLTFDKWRQLLVVDPQYRVTEVQILRQHLLVKASERQPTARIPARKVLVGPSWSVEVAARRNIEDTPAHCEVHGHVVRAVVGEKRRRREGLEDGRGGGRWQCGLGLGSEAVVGD